MPPRVFVDSNVLLDGLISSWSASRAILILSVRKVFKIVLAENVIKEVEENLLELLGENPEQGKRLVNDYDKLIKLLKPEIVPLTTKEEVIRSRHLIKHFSDVPILVAGIKAVPDWFVTENIKHFSQAGAKRTGLNIIHPDQLIKILTISK